MATTLKRSCVDAGLPERPPKSSKRRAPKACRCCRARKVRCNVMEFGAPCTNCRLDEVDCVIAEGKRKSRKTFIVLKPPVEVSESSPSDISHDHGDGRRESLPDLEPLVNWASYHSPPDAPRTKTHVPHEIYRAHGPSTFATCSARSPSIFSHNILSVDHRECIGAVMHQQITRAIEVSARIKSTPPTLPYYIKPLPTNIGPDEMTYLNTKGALSVPDSEVIQQILLSYAEWHHPLMPVVDISSMLQAITADSPTKNNISLLLLHAALYTGAAHVDIKWLHQAGHNSRRAARSAYYHKARLLYDFDCEPDRFTQVQALLLMTSWYASDEKDGWHWLGIAVATATSIGLHRLSPPIPTHTTHTSKKSNDTAAQAATAPSPTTPSLRHLQKRIWWSLIIRDRLMALGLRRPTCISLADSSVPMLTMADYVDDEHATGVVHMQLAKLSLCTGHVLAAQYSVYSAYSGRDRAGAGSDNGGSTGHTAPATTLMPKVAGSWDSGTEGVRACHAELEAWRAGLPEEARLEGKLEVEADADTDADTDTDTDADADATTVAAEVTTTPTVPKQRHLSGSELLNLALLHLIYYATLSALHRPQMLPQARMGAGTARESMRNSGRVVDENVEGITTSSEGSTNADTTNNANTSTASTSSPAPTPLASRTEVYAAATAITSLAKLLLDNNLVAHVPTFGTTVLLPALTKHLVDLRGLSVGLDANTGHNDANVGPKHPQQSHRHRHATDLRFQESLTGFAHCVTAMRILQSSYPGADVSMALVEAAVKRANIVINSPAAPCHSHDVAIAVADDAPGSNSSHTQESQSHPKPRIATCIADIMAYAETCGPSEVCPHARAAIQECGGMGFEMPEKTQAQMHVRMQQLQHQPTPPSSDSSSEIARAPFYDEEAEEAEEVDIDMNVDARVEVEPADLEADGGRAGGGIEAEEVAAVETEEDAAVEVAGEEEGEEVEIWQGREVEGEEGGAMVLGLDVGMDVGMDMDMGVDMIADEVGGILGAGLNLDLEMEMQEFLDFEGSMGSMVRY